VRISRTAMKKWTLKFLVGVNFLCDKAPVTAAMLRDMVGGTHIVVATILKTYSFFCTTESQISFSKSQQNTPRKWHRVSKEKRSETVCMPEIFRDPKHWPLKACKCMRGNSISSLS